MTIKTKLLLLAACSLLALFIISGLAFYGSDALGDSLERVTEAQIPARAAMNRVRYAKMEARQAMTEIGLWETDYSANARQKFLDILKRYDAQIEIAHTERKNYGGVARPPEVVEELKPIRARFGETWAAWEEDIARIRPLLEKLTGLPPGDVENQRALMAQIFPIFREQIDSYDKQDAVFWELIKAEAALSEKTRQDSRSSASFFRSLQITAFILAALVILLVSWLTIRAVITPLELSRQTMDDISTRNDMTRRVPIDSADEIGQMVKSFNNLVAHVQETLNCVRGSISGVLSTANALSRASAQVASSSSQQSSATSSMAAAVEEMTVSIGTVSGSADEAQQTTTEAADFSTQSGEIIRRTASEMSEIAESVSKASEVIHALGEESQQISSVVQVIKEVADQTNLLALNAAIEAARAGEQGRGFAVVADEVRKLAERTAQSTSDISGMIGKIQTSATEAVGKMQHVVEQVNSGQALAQQAGDRIASIQEGAGRVSSAVTEISSALKEQSVASQEIAKHVENIAQMTDENNAAAEEVSSNARSLEELAESANTSIQAFKL
ncbi:MAG: methyl-accepting chemotaxis protein [Zoogloeaceae bacterium]|jgi:methyl-accepting chemotaxis protein|nr:methyl-accepting chemotaxis protein [Zoogloeaceae bacterium]